MEGEIQELRERERAEQKLKRRRGTARMYVGMTNAGRMRTYNDIYVKLVRIVLYIAECACVCGGDGGGGGFGNYSKMSFYMALIFLHCLFTFTFIF